MNGHSIEGGSLEIAGKVEIVDDATPKGKIGSDILVDEVANLALEGVEAGGDITNNGRTTVDEDTEVTGNITNNDEFINDGTISGNISNNEKFTNNGVITGDVSNTA